MWDVNPLSFMLSENNSYSVHCHFFSVVSFAVQKVVTLRSFV